MMAAARTGRPQIPCCRREPDAHRDTLGQTHPFEVRVYRRHPFRIAGTAGIQVTPPPRYSDGTFKYPVAAKRRDFKHDIPRLPAWSLPYRPARKEFFHRGDGRGTAGNKFTA